jgi:OOP family OmpA-OmpF porin
VGEAFAGAKLEARSFEVGGHTCDLGSAPYNLDLSRRRATSVRRYLIEAHGIDPRRLTVRAYGEGAPLELGATEAIRSMNRRVEFALVGDE